MEKGRAEGGVIEGASGRRGWLVGCSRRVGVGKCMVIINGHMMSLKND